MAYRKRAKLQKSMTFRRKLRILRQLVHSNSDKTSSIIMDAFLCIGGLKLKLEALERETMNRVKHINHQQPLLEVTVEKQGDENRFQLKVRSEKGNDNLLHILEAFEDMAINVLDARVSCINHFVMEATVEVNDTDDNNIDRKATMDSSVLTEAILKAIESSTLNN